MQIMVSPAQSDEDSSQNFSNKMKGERKSQRLKGKRDHPSTAGSCALAFGGKKACVEAVKWMATKSVTSKDSVMSNYTKQASNEIEKPNNDKRKVSYEDVKDDIISQEQENTMDTSIEGDREGVDKIAEVAQDQAIPRNEGPVKISHKAILQVINSVPASSSHSIGSYDYISGNHPSAVALSSVVQGHFVLLPQQDPCAPRSLHPLAPTKVPASSEKMREDDGVAALLQISKGNKCNKAKRCLHEMSVSSEAEKKISSALEMEHFSNQLSLSSFRPLTSSLATFQLAPPLVALMPVSPDQIAFPVPTSIVYRHAMEKMRSMDDVINANDQLLSYLAQSTVAEHAAFSAMFGKRSMPDRA